MSTTNTQKDPIFTSMQSQSLSPSGQVWNRVIIGISRNLQPVTQLTGLGSRIHQISLTNSWTPEKPHSDPVLDLIDDWLADDSDYDDQMWPKLKDSLDTNRLSNRKLFND